MIDGLNHQAFEKKGIGVHNGSFAFVIENENSEFFGGISGVNYYGCFFVDILFVNEPFRNQGYGKQLMAKAEDLARQRECLFMAVNTMDFESKSFYEYLGFIVEFERMGFEKDSSMVFMRKNLY